MRDAARWRPGTRAGDHPTHSSGSVRAKGNKGKKTAGHLADTPLLLLGGSIVAVSNGVADDLSLTADIARERITTIYNPVVTPELCEKARSLLTTLGLSRVARRFYWEWADSILKKIFRPYSRLLLGYERYAAARLVILGEGQGPGCLVALARELGVAAEVDLPGFVENPFAYMTRAAVFILSSIYEGLSQPCKNVIFQRGSSKHFVV